MSETPEAVARIVARAAEDVARTTQAEDVEDPQAFL